MHGGPGSPARQGRYQRARRIPPTRPRDPRGNRRRRLRAPDLCPRACSGRTGKKRRSPPHTDRGDYRGRCRLRARGRAGRRLIWLEPLYLKPLTSASRARSTRPNSSLIRPSSWEPCERSPDGPTSSNCAQKPDILLAPMLPEPPLSVCAARSTAGASPFCKASSTASSREYASSRNMRASSATMSGSSSPRSLRSRASTSRSTGDTILCEAKPLGTRQIYGEGGPFSGGALDGDPAAVVLGHMPHYGETEPRSAGSLGAGLVHPVETLEDAWDLPLGDADAGV